MIAIKTILVATDFSEPSATALEYGRALARTFGASLHVLHVIDNVIVRGALTESMPAYYPDMLRDLEAASREHLDAILRDDDRRELGAVGVVLAGNGTAKTIAEYAKQTAVDLIVLGTHGRGAWSHLVMGGVAEKVVRTAPCPVLTVRHPQREFVAPDALQVVERTGT